MQPKDEIFEFFNSQFPFNQEGLTDFVNSFETRTYGKGEEIVKAGSVVRKLHFLEKGSIREYFSKDGREMNTNFYIQPQFITDFNAVIKKQATKRNLESLTEVRVREMNVETFSGFLLEYECGKQFVDEIFKALIEKKEEEEFKHFSLTPDELYLDLLKNNADWLQEIPLYHIATYLRMTPETLSRIRKRN